jgi:hypothetical protein
VPKVARQTLFSAKLEKNRPQKALPPMAIALKIDEF